MTKSPPVLFVLTSTAVLSATVCLTGCESSRSGSAGDPQQQCRDLLASWCSGSVDCFVAGGSIAPADAASVLDDCEESGTLTYEHDGILHIWPALFTRQTRAYDTVATDCDAAVGVSATYDACLSDIRGEACGPGGLESPGSVDAVGPLDCKAVIQVPL